MAKQPDAPIDFTTSYGKNLKHAEVSIADHREDAFATIVRLSRGRLTSRTQAMYVSGVFCVLVVWLGLYIASSAPPQPPASGSVPAGQVVPK